MNLTRFAALDFPSMDRDAAGLLVVLVSGRFHLPKPGKGRDEAPKPTDEQPFPFMEDVHHGDPLQSSLHYEGQTCYTRPGTDIYVCGSAWSPGGRATAALLVTVKVGRVEKNVLVIGDRTWERSPVGLTLSSPRPFASMPLLYERAFGGSTRTSSDTPLCDPQNPVGCGLYSSVRDAVGKPAPNLEDPNQRVGAWNDRPAPCSLGPVARSWQPRVRLAGTYDRAWIESRAPLWPKDLDERFFCAAAPGLSAVPHLQGNEPVFLGGLSPWGALEFRLPRARLVATAEFRGVTLRRNLALDTVLIEPDTATLTLHWRTAFPAHRLLPSHRVTTVRALHAWEAAA